jgi:hypothetical protein
MLNEATKACVFNKLGEGRTVIITHGWDHAIGHLRASIIQQ